MPNVCSAESPVRPANGAAIVAGVDEEVTQALDLAVLTDCHEPTTTIERVLDPAAEVENTYERNS